MPSAEDNVLRQKCALTTASFYNVDRLRFLGVRVLGPADGGGGPHVQFHDACIGFEPVTELVFGREERPARWEGKSVHVSVLDGIMCDNCSIVLHFER
jgi:hypothetical protein